MEQGWGRRIKWLIFQDLMVVTEIISWRKNGHLQFPIDESDIV